MRTIFNCIGVGRRQWTKGAHRHDDPKPNAAVVWEKIDFVLDATDYFPIRVDYYDRGKSVRRMEFSDVHDVSGRKIPFVANLPSMDAAGRTHHVQIRFA
ncbi:MAG: outer membrane lipoprotein-sorting protein [bacterium]